MSDSIGRIAVPTVINSGQTFPLITQYPFGFSVERPVIVHRFGSLDAKQEQRYYAGIGPRKFQFKRPNLNWSESRQLKAFWESMQGPWRAFTYNVPNPDGTTTGVLVTFESRRLVWFKCLRGRHRGCRSEPRFTSRRPGPAYAAGTEILPQILCFLL
jgi:hypothetical protein